MWPRNTGMVRQFLMLRHSTDER